VAKSTYRGRQLIIPVRCRLKVERIIKKEEREKEERIGGKKRGKGGEKEKRKKEKKKIQYFHVYSTVQRILPRNFTSTLI
jgi:hypothetical protein